MVSHHPVAQKMRKLYFNSGNTIDCTMLQYTPPLRIDSAKLWMAVDTWGGKASCGSFAGCFHKGKVTWLSQKNKKGEKYTVAYIIGTIQKHLLDTPVPRYPTDLPFGMQFSYVTLLPVAKLGWHTDLKPEDESRGVAWLSYFYYSLYKICGVLNCLFKNKMTLFLLTIRKIFYYCNIFWFKYQNNIIGQLCIRFINKRLIFEQLWLIINIIYTIMT